MSNKPGVYSARWVKKNNYTNVFKCIRKKIEEKGEAMPGQEAFFNCTLALLYSPAKVKTFEGILEGTLTYPPEVALALDMILFLYLMRQKKP